jgi:adenylate kinase
LRIRTRAGIPRHVICWTKPASGDIMAQEMSRIVRSCRLAALGAWAAMASAVYADGLVVLVVGPPGSGRTTQANLLGKELKLPVVAADDLIKRNPEVFRQKRSPSDARPDPRLDDAMNQVVAAVLATSDLSKGLVLDGYPATKAHGEYLQNLRKKFNLPRAILVNLNVPDDVVRKRLKSLNRDIDQELKDYHREFDFLRSYFPEADVRSVDATQKPDVVAREIRKLLAETAK